MILKTITITNIPAKARVFIARDKIEMSADNIISNKELDIAITSFTYNTNQIEPTLIRVRKAGWKPIEVRTHYNDFNEDNIVIEMEPDIGKVFVSGIGSEGSEHYRKMWDAASISVGTEILPNGVVRKFPVDDRGREIIP